jgi:hypothetical protein
MKKHTNNGHDSKSWCGIKIKINDIGLPEENENYSLRETEIDCLRCLEKSLHQSENGRISSVEEILDRINFVRKNSVFKKHMKELLK